MSCWRRRSAEPSVRGMSDRRLGVLKAARATRFSAFLDVKTGRFLGQAVHTHHRRQAFARRLSRRSARHAEGRPGRGAGDFRRQPPHPRGVRPVRRRSAIWRWRRRCSTASCAISSAAIRRTRSPMPAAISAISTGAHDARYRRRAGDSRASVRSAWSASAWAAPRRSWPPAASPACRRRSPITAA